MSVQGKNAIAVYIREMAREHHVAYAHTSRDVLAHQVTRLAGDEVQFDEVEQLLIALQRNGHLSRIEMVRLQAAYLREARQ
jgi:flagellar biosynthesis protein FlhB